MSTSLVSAIPLIQYGNSATARPSRFHLSVDLPLVLDSIRLQISSPVEAEVHRSAKFPVLPFTADPLIRSPQTIP
jgi:hypothetical protein